MDTYIDSYSRYHHKKVTKENPIPSNNSWIYSAYANKLELPLDAKKLYQCFELCTWKGIFVLRSPGKVTPYLSRDEVIGTIALGLCKPEHLNGWNFYGRSLPKFNAIKLLKQLWELRPSVKMTYRDTVPATPKYSLEFKHRNYFWQNNLDQLYRFAFSVPLQDRHFILKTWGKFQWYNPVHVFYAIVAKVDSMLPKKSGIKWLKYGGEKNKLAMIEEFPMDHPIRMRVMCEL